VKLEIHYADEWAALYVDGKLERVGDTYLAEERAFELLGVTTVQDSAFLRGQTSREGCAQNLDEVGAYRDARDTAIERARRLEAEAREALAMAEKLRRGNR
jgi:hypothetical protein